jgi:predicted dehydrogenase
MDRVEMVRPPLVREEPLKLEIASFVKAVRTGSEPEVSGAVAREAMAIAEEIRKDLSSRLARFRSGR